MTQIRSTSPARRRSSFIERTLVDINDTLEQSVFAEKISRQAGLLQSLDPRLKLVGLLGFLFAVNFSYRLEVIAALYLFTLLLAGFSRIPLGFFIKRVWLVILIFTGIVALPAIFITPGAPLAQLPLGIVITRPGAVSALFLLLRVGTSVSYAVLLILTTPWNSILKALGVLRVPDVIILVLGMTYRYIHLLLHLTTDMFQSRQSRILRRMDGRQQRQLLASTSGVLIGKSLQLSSEVYLAMESRGFRGYPRTIESFRFRRADWLAAFLILILTGIALWIGR